MNITLNKALSIIKEVAELPVEWRRTALIKLHSGPTAARNCANELDAIVGMIRDDEVVVKSTWVKYTEEQYLTALRA